VSKIFEQLLAVRGVGRDFLMPKYEGCLDPEKLPGMQEAVARIRQAVEQGEKILIYGDYDVDGVTASTVMWRALKLAGVKEVEVTLPNRFKDGYGMSEKVVEQAVSAGVGLVVTVDCGSRNLEIVKKLAERGIETIVTDHHECGEELPAAVAVLNPKRKDVEVPAELRDLAGVGVAFKMAQALVKAGLIPAGREKWLLDLVLIGTICDSMRMTAENRRLCFYGMKVLGQTRWPGLKELLRTAGVKRMNGDAIGFQLGPRLNAAGRMDTAEKALQLLMTEKRTEAAKLAMELEKLNAERKKQQRTAVEAIRKSGVGDDSVIVVDGEWHEGVIGIIAGRLVEEYQRPAFVFARNNVEQEQAEPLPDVADLAVDGNHIGMQASHVIPTTSKSGLNLITTPGKGSACSHLAFSSQTQALDILKGSGRSFGEFSLAEALKACEEVIIGGGGHAEACGVKVEARRLDDFRRQVNEYYRGLKLKDQERFLAVREDLVVRSLKDLSLELIEEMKQLEPFAEGNAEPVFLLPEVRVMEVARLGADGEHLRMVVEDDKGESLKVMQFFAPAENLKIQPGGRANIWITLTENEFRGIRSAEGRVVDLTSA